MKIAPTKQQLEFMDWEFGGFFHFGIRSFFPGHRDWDGNPMPAEQFNPTQLDCGQWIRTLKAAGGTYAILVCKHHDGFANWPSAYSDYSVAQSPWKDGKGDVVREFVDACRENDIKVGLYYSPAQWQGKVSFENETDYDDYFINQISELLSNYGKIDYLWFDGCGSENHQYDKEHIIRAIRSLQPEILIFEMWDPDTAWVGNEDGYANNPNWNTRPFGANGTPRFLPHECDFMMRANTWFDCAPNEDTVKSVAELVGIYEYSVGRGANFLINIGPDSRGLLPEKDANRLLEFGEEIRRRYGTALPYTALCPGDEEDTFVIEAPERKELIDRGHAPLPVGELVDTVVLQEDLSQGDSVKAFEIYASLPRYLKGKFCIYHGTTIGHKAICRFPAVRASALTVKILDHEGEYRISDMKAYRVGKE